MIEISDLRNMKQIDDVLPMGDDSVPPRAEFYWKLITKYMAKNFS